MEKTSSDALREVVERLQGCTASFLQTVTVDERHGTRIVWEGVVHVIALEGHPTATRCYAWSSPVEGSDRRKFYAVLQQPPVTSAQLAVRAAIVGDQKKAQPKNGN